MARENKTQKTFSYVSLITCIFVFLYTSASITLFITMKSFISHSTKSAYLLTMDKGSYAIFYNLFDRH